MERSHLLASALPLVSAALSVTFFCLWMSQKDRYYILNWCLSYACGLFGAGIGLARIFLDDAAWFSFLGNAFLVGVAYFAARGLVMRHAGRTLDHVLLPIYAATVLAGLWFGFVEPGVFSRGTASSLGAAAMFTIAAVQALKSGRTDKVDRLIVAAFLVTAAMLIGRPLFILALDAPVRDEAEVTGSWWGISFRILAVLSWVSIAILFLQRITIDLLNEITHQSRTDLLTGILNRRGFFALVGGLAGNGTMVAVLCDIDDFKSVNDTFGHKAGDTVIRNFAQVLSHAAAPLKGVVGRLGGEEFVGLLPGADVVQARAFAEGVRTAFAAMRHEGVAASHVVTVSIGVAVASGAGGLDTVLNHADAALYRAKSKGKNCVEVAAIPLSQAPRRITKIRQRRS